jgi:hypothetical protein
MNWKIKDFRFTKKCKAFLVCKKSKAFLSTLQMSRKFEMKKAQMEIFGLAIIVILVFIGMMFLLMFYMKTPDTYSAKEKDNDQTMAQNLVDTIFSLNTTCGRDMDELLVDCYVNKDAPNLIYKCEGMDSCEYTFKVLNNTLNRTLILWNKAFKMSILGEARGSIYDREYMQCIQSVRGSRYIPLYSTALQPDSPDESGVIEVRLDICR